MARHRSSIHPAVCRQAFGYASPTVLLFVGGNPATPWFSIPRDPVLLGGRFCFQARALQQGFCLLASNARSVMIGAT
jgi:hypothetical protein